MSEKNGEIHYTSQIYKLFKAAAIGTAVYFGVVLAIIFVFRALHQPGLGTFLFVIISTVPFLFQKKYKQTFTKNVVLKFTPNSLIIEEYKNDETVARTDLYNWSDIAFYKFYFSVSNVTFMVIYLKNGSSKTFPFVDNKNEEQATAEKSVFSIFNFFVYQYNANTTSDLAITPKIGFLTTKRGTFLLYLLCLIAIIIIVLNFVLTSQILRLPAFIAAAIVLSVSLKRGSDNSLYEKMMAHLKPLSPFD